MIKRGSTLQRQSKDSKDNLLSYLHGHVKIGGLSVFSFDEHFPGSINQKHQTVSPCHLVMIS